MSNRTLIIGLALGVISLLLYGFHSRGGGSRSPDAIRSLDARTDASYHGVTETMLAPDFALPTPDGTTIRLSDYRGKKPVVLDFWASWCPNCRRDMPKLSRMYETYRDRIEVIGINLQEATPTVVRYVSSSEITFPIVLDPEGIASRAYGVRYTNFHVLIDREGKVVRTIPGDIREAELISLL